MLLRHHAQRDTAGNMPFVFRRLFAGPLIERKPLALPGLIVALLGQFARLAQPIQHFAIRWMFLEPGLRQFPQLHEGTVVEGQLLVWPENRHRRCKLVQCVGMGIDVLLQLCFGRRNIGRIECRAYDLAIVQRHMREFKRPPLPANHRKALGGNRLLLVARSCREVAFGFIEGCLMCKRAFKIALAGRRDESLVAPLERQRLVAQPDGNGQGIENGFEVRRLRLDRFFFQPDRRHAANGASARGDAALAAIAHRQRERHAIGAQIVERLRECGCVRPGKACIEHRVRAAIGERAAAITPPYDEGLAACGDQRIAFADGGAGAGAGFADIAAKAAGRVLFGQRPERHSKGQRNGSSGNAGGEQCEIGRCDILGVRGQGHHGGESRQYRQRETCSLITPLDAKPGRLSLVSGTHSLSPPFIAADRDESLWNQHDR